MVKIIKSKEIYTMKRSIVGVNRLDSTEKETSSSTDVNEFIFTVNLVIIPKLKVRLVLLLAPCRGNGDNIPTANTARSYIRRMIPIAAQGTFVRQIGTMKNETNIPLIWGQRALFVSICKIGNFVSVLVSNIIVDYVTKVKRGYVKWKIHYHK